MKKFLKSLDFDTLNKIAKDIGFEHLAVVKKINSIALYYRQYGLTWQDLASRYQIKIN